MSIPVKGGQRAKMFAKQERQRQRQHEKRRKQKAWHHSSAPRCRTETAEKGIEQRQRKPKFYTAVDAGNTNKRSLHSNRGHEALLFWKTGPGAIERPKRKLSLEQSFICVKWQKRFHASMQTNERVNYVRHPPRTLHATCRQCGIVVLPNLNKLYPSNINAGGKNAASFSEPQYVTQVIQKAPCQWDTLKSWVHFNDRCSSSLSSPVSGEL